MVLVYHVVLQGDVAGDHQSSLITQFGIVWVIAVGTEVQRLQLLEVEYDGLCALIGHVVVVLVRSEEYRGRAL